MANRGLLFAAVMLALAGCASTQAEEYRDAADDLAEDLIDQLEQRTDTRQVRLLVTEFQSDNPMGGRPATHRHANLSKHIKHQLTKELATEVVVIEDDGPKTTRQADLYIRATELGATTIVVGNYSHTEKDRILVVARIVDLESRNVLASAEEELKLDS
ncbi:MAG: FlgO family outer membrane protein [Planctomycetota bacterium]